MADSTIAHVPETSPIGAAAAARPAGAESPPPPHPATTAAITIAIIHISGLKKLSNLFMCISPGHEIPKEIGVQLIHCATDVCARHRGFGPERRNGDYPHLSQCVLCGCAHKPERNCNSCSIANIHMSPNDDITFAYDEVLFAAARNAANIASDSGMPILFSEVPKIRISRNVRPGLRRRLCLVESSAGSVCWHTDAKRFAR